MKQAALEAMGWAGYVSLTVSGVSLALTLLGDGLMPPLAAAFGVALGALLLHFGK
jgi:hypothetical protein